MSRWAYEVDICAPLVDHTLTFRLAANTSFDKIAEMGERIANCLPKIDSTDTYRLVRIELVRNIPDSQDILNVPSDNELLKKGLLDHPDVKRWLDTVSEYRKTGRVNANVSTVKVPCDWIRPDLELSVVLSHTIWFNGIVRIDAPSNWLNEKGLGPYVDARSTFTPEQLDRLFIDASIIRVLHETRRQVIRGFDDEIFDALVAWKCERKEFPKVNAKLMFDSENRPWVDVCTVAVCDNSYSGPGTWRVMIAQEHFKSRPKAREYIQRVLELAPEHFEKPVAAAMVGKAWVYKEFKEANPN